MGALFSRVKTWVSAEDVTYSDLNAEFDNILTNLTAANVDDYSANVNQMQTTADPGEVGTESLATSVAGEIARLRNMILEITGEDQWYESPVSSILGLANAIGTGLTANRLVSGRVRSSTTNTQPIFLVPDGTAATVEVQGASTNFIYYVNGTEYTISTDVSLTGLTVAPSSNNTCLVDDAQAADDTYTKYTGEDGSSIPVDNMGSEISSLVGTFQAFKLAGVATEYFLAYVESSTSLTKAMRGFFFDSADAPVKRTAYTNNDTITLMKLTWIFAKSDGTLTATYNNPVWAKTQPTSPSLGDYWFDLANNKWKVYGVGSYSDANAHLIGVCIQDGTGCVAARSFEFFAGYEDLNTHELFYDTAAQVKSRHPGSNINVWGTTIKSDRNLRTWSLSTDLDDPDKLATESASTYYWAYMTNFGDVVLSDIKPYDRREDLQGYYHPYASWRCVGSFFNDGSSDIDANSVNSYYSRYGQAPLVEKSAASHIELPMKVIRLSGATSAHYLPPAAKTRGQEFMFIHGGTSLTQVYTLTTFGSETFNTNAATTFPLYTAGEMVRVYSDGVGYIVTGRYAQTAWTSAGALTVTATGTSCAKGTTSTDAFLWRRNGRETLYKYTYVQTGAGTAGTGAYIWTLPSGLSADTTVINTNGSSITTLDGSHLGEGSMSNQTNASGASTVPTKQISYSSTEFLICGQMNLSGADGREFRIMGATTTGIIVSTINFGSANKNFRIAGSYPVTGWQP